MEPESYALLKQEISERMAADQALLDQLRNEIRPLRNEVRSIQHRTTTAISLVATDGGNNSSYTRSIGSKMMVRTRCEPRLDRERKMVPHHLGLALV